jgi:hypothetical protein
MLTLLTMFLASAVARIQINNVSVAWQMPSSGYEQSSVNISALVAAGDEFSDVAIVAMASENMSPPPPFPGLATSPALYGIVDDKGTYRPHQRVALPADTVHIEGLALGNSDGQPCAYVLAEHKVERISWPDGKVTDYAMDWLDHPPPGCGTGNHIGSAGERIGMVLSGDDLFLLGEHGCWFGPNGIVSIKACDKPPCAIEPLLGWKKTKRTPVDDPVSMAVRKSTGEMYMSTCGVSGGAGCTIFKVTPDGKWAVHAEGLYSLRSEWGYSGAGYMAVDDNNGDLYIRANVLEGEGAAARRVSRLLLVEGNCIATPTEPCPVSVVYDPKRDHHADWPAALAEGSGGPMVVHGGYLFISAGFVVYRVGIGAL